MMLRAVVWWALVLVLLAVPHASRAQTGADTTAVRWGLGDATVVVDPAEPSYVQYAAQDLATYLGQVAGTTVPVSTGGRTRAKSIRVAIGVAATKALGVDVGAMDDLRHDGFVIRSFDRDGGRVLVVAGRDPHGTNAGVASLLRSIRVEGGSPYVDAPIDRRESPSYALRGIHLNGWPLNYPYAFRAWKEADWKRFVDLAWAQRINLFYLWPFMEVLPVPLSPADEAYLQEVRRVVDYAQRQRGMDVWIMQSANRIGVSDCNTPDPRFRPYWVNDCQKDMNPADPEQFARIERSFGALYTIVDNANAYVMIDSDPGGWPQSPLSDQARIFQAARRLLDQHAVPGTRPMLIDWMHVGWGRHKFFTSTDSVVAAYDWTDKNPDESDVAFMGETIRTFKAQVPEPWGLIAGQPPYLSIVAQEQVLGRTVYLPYGAIESEPAFPATNLGQDSVRRVFTRAGEFAGLRGVMGNNQLVLLQFPRTHYFFASAWDTRYLDRSEPDALLDLAGLLYPEQRQLIADAFLALRETDAERIAALVSRLESIERSGAGRPGALGRLLFPDSLAIARNLRMQLEIRRARQAFVAAMRDKPTVSESSRLVEQYFDRLLAWNKETGWDKMIDITVWPRPIYETGKDLTEAIYRLKQLLAAGAPYTSFSQIDAFFTPIANTLRARYGEDSVMVGCIEPFKLAVVQSQ
jgi:hypothetical protein